MPPGVVDAIVVVDDGSTDDTASLAGRAGAVVLTHPRNRGVGAAIRTGIEYAKANGFDLAVVISGAGKSPPAQIPEVLAPILDGHADFVQASRYLPGGSQLRMPALRRFGTRAYTWLFGLLARRRVTDASSGFRAFRLSLLDDPRIDITQPWLDRYELEPYLLFKILHSGARIQEVPTRIEYPPEDGRAYSKMRAFSGWWSIFRPVLFLALGLRR